MSGQRISIEALPDTLMQCANDLYKKIQGEFKSRGERAANELRNAELIVLRGQRSGRRYNVPGTGRVKYNKKNKTATITYRTYQASAPGEPPAVRTGAYRNSFRRRFYAVTDSAGNVKGNAVIQSYITTPKGHNLGNLLEGGTGRMAPRPHKERIIEKATPNIKRIYKQPYI